MQRWLRFCALRWLAFAVPAIALLTGALALSACHPKGPAVPKARHVVLISVDTLRADHVGPYAPGRVITPALDAFAAEGVVFEQASTASTTTLPSHTSLMTGRWPIQHGVPRNGYVVHSKNVMLAERLRAEEFATIGVSSAQELSKLLGFAQGFDVWNQDKESFTGFVSANRDARRADVITDAAITEIDARKPGSLFLFVHYIDPHSPYDPPEPFRSMYGPIPEDFFGSFEAIREAQKQHHLAAGAGRAPVHSRLSSLLLHNTPKRPLGTDSLLAKLYAGEASFVDHHLGRLFDALRERNLWEDTLVLVTSDHGETFWEHADVWSHGIAPYETTVRVPLLVKLPGNAHAGTRISTPVSNIDVAPTVLEAIGAKPDSDFAGRSLFETLKRTPADRSLVSIAPLPATESQRTRSRSRGPGERAAPHSVRSASWKYLRSEYLELEELYDLENDPDETRNLLSGTPTPEVVARAARLRSDLDDWLATASPLPSEFYPRTRDHDTPEAEQRRRAMWQRLRELGYVTDEGATP